MKILNTILSQGKVAVRLGLTIFRNILSGLFVCCLCIHLWIKDAIDVVSIVYYSTPLPILALMSLVLGILWLRSQHHLVATICFLSTLGGLTVWCYESFSFNASVSTPNDVKLFFWNAAKNRRVEEVASHVQNFDADILGFVEAGIKRKKVHAWKNRFQDYEVQVLTGGMALFVKGKILSKETGELGERGHFNLLEVVLKGRRFHVLLVDIDGNPLHSRAPAFATLDTLLRSYAHTELVVMGDFNTPLDSVLFESFRCYLTHAFESGGHGFTGTWPLPLPVLAIDHIWVSNTIKVVSCNLNWSRHSDHRSIVASISLPTQSLSANCLSGLISSTMLNLLVMPVLYWHADSP